MTKPILQPQWRQSHVGITHGYSLEITAKDVAALRAAAAGIPPGTSVSVTFLPTEKRDDRVLAAKAVRELGFEPMAHFSARRFGSPDGFHTYLNRLVDEAGVRRCFVISGDLHQAVGPYNDSSRLIATGAFERAGIEVIGVAGHPEGHSVMSDEEAWQVLDYKCSTIAERGMEPLIVTQFGFDAERVLAWLEALRQRGITAPVRIGVPGPAGIKRLLQFAARCGVGASASVMTRYGISITQLLGTAGPDRMLAALAAGLGPQHGTVRLHFYPFGGLEKTVEWIAAYDTRN